jgi:2',3'-cyclic-nucleotide 2'-phosphodiesterase (5'-nucleotidase family)
MKRLYALLLLLVLLAAPIAAVAASVTIVHSCDNYGEVVPCGWENKRLGGFARRATVIDEIKKSYPNVVVVDVGNSLFRSTTLTSISEDADRVAAGYVARAMAMIKYDVVNVGPNDLAAGLDFLMEVKRDTGLTIISSNIYSTKTMSPVFETSVVKTVGGVKVGFFGIAGGGVSGAHDRDTFIFADAEDTGKEMVKELSGKADLIVALLATDRKEAYDFAKAVGGIDLVITTSEPQVIPVPTPYEKTYLVSADEKGKRVGRVTVTVGAARPYRVTGAIVPVGSLIFRDRALDALENEYYKWLLKNTPEAAGEPPDTVDKE